MYDLTGKTVLITGAAKRIGRSLTLKLAEQGTNVIIHYNNAKEEANTLQDEVTTLGSRAFTIQADLANTTSGKQLIEDVLKEAGQLDILINNASIFPETNEIKIQEGLTEKVVYEIVDKDTTRYLCLECKKALCRHVWAIKKERGEIVDEEAV